MLTGAVDLERTYATLASEPFTGRLVGLDGGYVLLLHQNLGRC
jgi:hypothetical protein